MNVFYVLTIQIPRPSLRIVYEAISIFLKHINMSFLTIFYQLILFVLGGGGGEGLDECSCGCYWSALSVAPVNPTHLSCFCLRNTGID